MTYDNPALADWTLYRVVLGIILITLGAVGAAGGGIGGGGLYVPLLIIVIGFETKEAVPVSQGCIVGAAMAHLILNAPKKHPLLDVPVIDYAALLVLEPMLLAGSLFGVMLNGMLPSVVILLILVFVLSLGAYKTGRRALKITRSEREQKERIVDIVELTKNPEKTEVGTVEESSVETVEIIEAGGIRVAGNVVDTDVPLTSFSATHWIMWKKLGMVSALWIILCCAVVVRGSTVGESSIAGVYYCSSGFWVVTAAIPVIQILFSAIFGKLEIDRFKSQSLEDWVASSNALMDYTLVEWNWTGVVKYMVYAFVCGALAGCLGIGGGLVLSPLLLELGFFPAVASAISGMAVLVTSTTALFAYGLSNKVYWEFVGILMPLTFISTLIGKIKIDSYAERNNKQSVIIWSVAIFLACCLIMLTTRGLIELVSDPSFEFTSPCES